MIVSLATQVLVALPVALWWAGAVAADPQAGPLLQFHRVHVPAGRLDEVQLGDDRYVPMSIAEFEAALARAADEKQSGAVAMPRAVADTVTYTARLTDDGMLAGLVTSSVSPATAEIMRALPLGPLAARRGTFTTESGGRDAVIFGTQTAGSFMQTLEGGTYTCEFSCPPVAPGAGRFRLPLVPALATTVELELPAGTEPTLFGAAARTAVVLPPADADQPWRIEAGPGTELGLTIRTQADDAAGLAVWSAVDIRGQQAAVSATVRPSDVWGSRAAVLDKDPAVRITGVQAETTAEPLAWDESADGRQVVVDVPPWLAGGRADLTVQGVAPAEGPVWRLPLLTAPQRHWSGGGCVVTVDSASGVAAVDLDDCRIVTTAVAARWPVPATAAARLDEAATRPAIFNVEEQGPGATCRMSLRPGMPTFDVARVTTVEISPRALLGRAVCDIRVVDGEAFEITARLAPGWIPDSVELLEWGDETAGGDQQPLKAVANSVSAVPLDWRFVQSPGGDALRIGLPLAATPARGLGLRVVGHRAGIQPGAAFMTSEIDMVRFDGEATGMAVIDVKTVADSFMEVDDAPIGVLPAEGRLARLVEGDVIRGRIAGGELSPARRGRLVTRRPPVDADVAVRLETRGERLTETFLFDCRPTSGAVEAVVVDFSEPVGAGLDWVVVDPAGIAVATRLLTPDDAAARAAKRPESIAESWLVEFRPAVAEAVVVRASRTVPFAAAVPVPLAWVREASAAQGLVTIASAEQLLPDVQNQRLLELPTRLDGRATGRRSLEFAFGPPPPVAGPAAELRPADSGVDARAWAWREDVNCWCEESGTIECESRFDIENEGRDAVVVTVPAGQRLQGVAIDGIALPGDAVAAAGTTLRVLLPAAERRVDLVVRSTLARDPAVGWWLVTPQGCGVDLPILERSVRLLLPPELEALVTDGGYRSVDPVAAGWLRRLFGIAPAGGVGAESRATEAGFRAEAFVARGSRDGGGVVVIRRRLLASAALLAALIVGAAALLLVPRRWSLAITLCLTAAVAAIWAPAPLYEVARAAWWAALAGCLCGMVPRRAAFAAALVGSVAAIAAPVRAAEPQSFRVFVTPGGGGDMALVPEPLFRQLAGGGQAAATVRVVRCVVFARSQADAAPWRVELDLDADAGGTLVLEEPAGAVWQAGESDTDGGVLVRPLGKGVQLTASTAGRQRVVVNLLPHTERRGGLETAEMRLPGTPAAAIHLVGEPLSANAVACEFAAAGRPFLRAPLVDATSLAPVFDVSGAERVRLVRPLDPRDRIAAEPTAATTVNDVFWGLDACTVQTTLTLDAADLLPAVLLRADERLEKMEVVDADAAVIQAVGPGRWRLELSRANRGKTVVTLASRMPLADPVGRFRVPAVWLENLVGEVRTLQVQAAADLDIEVDPPAGSGITAPEFEAGSPPQVTVRRRRQQPRGVQNLAVTFGIDRVTLALRAQIDATTLALTELPVQVPPGCIIDRVSLQEDDLVSAEGRPQPAVDIVWTRTATDRVVIVVQQPRAGRFRLVVDARLRIRPPARGRVPLMRTEIAGGAPLMLSCADETAAHVAVRLAEGTAVRSAGSGASPAGVPTDRAEVFDDAPGPEYHLEGVEVAPVTAADTATEVPATARAGTSRVELTDVFVAIDGRGRGRGAVRFDVETTETTLRLRLPRGLRLYDLIVDGAQVPTVPRAADTWEVRLHGVAWPRTILAIFAGDVGPDFASGRPISLPPPALLGLPAGDVIWTILPPPGFDARFAEPARPLDAASHTAARRGAQRRIGERFAAALATSDPRQQERLRQLIELRRGGGVTGAEAAWQRAVGWPSPATAGSDVAFAATASANDLTLRAVRQPDDTTSGRGLATCGIVIAAGLAWSLATWKAGRRRQAESDLAHAADHR
jgi:hypothetical protein